MVRKLLAVLGFFGCLLTALALFATPSAAPPAPVTDPAAVRALAPSAPLPATHADCHG